MESIKINKALSYFGPGLKMLFTASEASTAFYNEAFVLWLTFTHIGNLTFWKAELKSKLLAVQQPERSEVLSLVQRNCSVVVLKEICFQYLPGLQQYFSRDAVSKGSAITPALASRLHFSYADVSDVPEGPGLAEHWKIRCLVLVDHVSCSLPLFGLLWLTKMWHFGTFSNSNLFKKLA